MTLPLDLDKRGYIHERALRAALLAYCERLADVAPAVDDTPTLWAHRVYVPLGGGTYTFSVQHRSTVYDDGTALVLAERARGDLGSDIAIKLYLYGNELGRMTRLQLRERDRAFAFLAAYTSRRTPDRFVRDGDTIVEGLWLHAVELDGAHLVARFCVDGYGEQAGAEFAERAVRKLLASDLAPAMPIVARSDPYH